MHRPKAFRRALAIALTASCLALASCSGTDEDGPGYFTVAIVDLAGEPRILGTLPHSVFAPRVSPDGTRLAFELRDPAPAGAAIVERVWIAPLRRLSQRRALPQVGKARNWAPMWTRDGQRVAFLVSGEGNDTLYWRRADGTGEAERLVEGLSAEDTSPDGRQLSFITLPRNGDYDISLLELATGKVTPVVDRPGSEQHSSSISPDGHWIAYASNETGAHEIWVEPLPGNGKRHRATHAGGSHPVWSPDGRSLFYDRDPQLYRIAFHTDPDEPKFGEPEALPITGYQQGYRRRQFDVMPDGEHLLLLYPPGALR